MIATKLLTVYRNQPIKSGSVDIIHSILYILILAKVNYSSLQAFRVK